MKSETVLLITSAQNDLLSPNGKAWSSVSATVSTQRVPEKLAALTRAARRAGILVIHSPVVLDYRAMAEFEPKSALQGVIIGNQLLAKGDAGSDFVDACRPASADVVLRPRQGFSSFWAHTIDAVLEEVRPATITIAGMLAEGCVSSHARDAVENGYSPIVVSDAIGATSPELLAAAQLELALHAGALRTAEEVIATWGG
jgi:nicotinamidase-related amidase